MIRKYITWVFFLVYPLTNAFMPNLDLGVVELDPFRIYLLIPLIFVVDLFLRRGGRIRMSKESVFLSIYMIFALFNSFRTGNFIIANVMNFLFPVLFILAMENLDYEEKDLGRFYKVMAILATAIFTVSLMQKFVDRSIYTGVRGQALLRDKFLAYEGAYRHASILGSIDFYQAGMAIGLLCILFMFLNFEKIQLKYAALCGLMLVSTFLTFTRSNWIIPLIGLAFFVYFKPLHKRITWITLLGIGGVMLYLLIFPGLQESAMYQDRVAADTYEGRFDSINIYFEHFWGRNMLMGWGVDSSLSGEFRSFDRPEAHNGYLEIMFRNGLIGMFLYFGFWYYVFKRALLIRKRTGNGVFIVFVMIFLASNFIYKFVYMGHFGYLMMLFYMNIWYQLYVQKAGVSDQGSGVRESKRAKTLATDYTDEHG